MPTRPGGGPLCSHHSGRGHRSQRCQHCGRAACRNARCGRNLHPFRPFRRDHPLGNPWHHHPASGNVEHLQSRGEWNHRLRAPGPPFWRPPRRRSRTAWWCGWRPMAWIPTIPPRSGLVRTPSSQQWNDCSGNSKHATNADGSHQPKYIASGLNGKPVLRFTQDNDDNGDRLKLGDLSADFPTAGSVFVVATHQQRRALQPVRQPQQRRALGGQHMDRVRARLLPGRARQLRDLHAERLAHRPGRMSSRWKAAVALRGSDRRGLTSAPTRREYHTGSRPELDHRQPGRATASS